MHLLTVRAGESRERRMLIGRHSFIRQSKLSDVAGRIDYISNPKRQEYLYETYQTEGATPEFWKNLARENQLDFKASGSAGKCIEGREFIIALPESFVQYRAGDVVRLFTETFHKRYGMECSAALHHNKTKTNYHIHLVFSERKMLEQPEVKIATRNMFYDEQGKHRRTKKEILDETRKMLEDSLLRSVFWKYENYKDAKDLSNMRELKKQIQVCQDALLEKERENERLTFTYHDYEFYYRKNHRDPSFTLEQAAKNERMQSACREKEGYTWMKTDGKYVCPSCRKEAICCEGIQQLTEFCPFCGTDLRK